ncbi:lipocalin family protein [Phocaeicola sp.]
MKKKMLVAILLMGLLNACGNNSASIVGVWVEPVPNMENQMQGIKIEEGGVASSVNMSTLVYESWKQEGDKLFVTGKSIGNRQTIEFSDTMEIKKLTADSLVLNNRGMEIHYVKQK